MLSLLSTPGLSLKLVRPKALLDNCFRVMELLYCSCCKETLWVGLATAGQGIWAQVCAQSPHRLGDALFSWLFLEAGMGLECGDKNVWHGGSVLQGLFFFVSRR